MTAELVSPWKSPDTSGSSVTSSTPRRRPPAASRKASLISSTVAGSSRVADRSTRLTSGIGTRTAMPTIRPASSGMTLSMARAAPVFVGVMLSVAARARRKSPLVPSRSSWSRVKAWMVVSPPETPNDWWSNREHRGQAVGGAGGGRDDVVPVAVVLGVVHAHHDGDVLVPGGGGDQHLVGAGPEVGDGVVAVREPPGGLDDDVDVEGVPGAQQRVGLGRDADGMAVDHEVVVVVPYRPRSAPKTESYLNRWAHRSGLARTEFTTTTSRPGAPRRSGGALRPIRPNLLMRPGLPGTGVPGQDSAVAIRLRLRWP